MKTLTRFAASLAVCGLSTTLMAQESDEIFKSLDKNNDGILAADEVSEAQQRFFERLVRAGDENEDGKLSLAEYQATLKADERPASTPAGSRGEGGRGRFDPTAMFDRFDKNNDGKLSRSELPEEALDRMGRIFEAAGKDEISKEEFGQAIGKMMRAGSRPGGLGAPGGRPGGPQFFSQLDKNKDGKLSKDELPEQLRDRMASLFERVGTDEISLEQLARMRGQREGDRPERGPGDRGKSEREMRRDGDARGERPERDGERPPMREGDREGRRPDGRPGFGGGPGMRGPGGSGGFAFMRVLDANKDGSSAKVRHCELQNCLMNSTATKMVNSMHLN